MISAIPIDEQRDPGRGHRQLGGAVGAEQEARPRRRVPGTISPGLKTSIAIPTRPTSSSR